MYKKNNPKPNPTLQYAQWCTFRKYAKRKNAGGAVVILQKYVTLIYQIFVGFIALTALG